MISLRQLRRRRVSSLKLFLACFILISVFYWIYHFKTADENKSTKSKTLSISIPGQAENRGALVFKEIYRDREKFVPLLEKNVKNTSSFRNPALLHKLRFKPSDSKKQTVKENEIKSIGFTSSAPFMKVTPGLGEGGVPVHLTPEEQTIADEQFNSAAFNVYLSDRISLNRSVPDPRNPKYNNLCLYSVQKPKML